MNLNEWSVVVGIVGGAVAATLALVQAFLNLSQRKKEHRWRQAEMGKKLIDEAWSDPKANSACLILDGLQTTVESDSGVSFSVSPEVLMNALDEGSDLTEIVQLLRDRADILFFYFGRMEHFVRTGLVTFDDLVSPADYYVELLATRKPTVAAYLKSFRFYRARQFLERFESWATVGAK
jgi:hypothetical protein